MRVRNEYPPVLDIVEASVFLRVSTKTLETYVKAGRVPASKVGNQWRFLKSQLEDWLRNGGTLASSDKPAD